MLKRIVALLCLVSLLMPLLPAAVAEESFYAYFDDARWMRSEPRANTPNVINVPQRSVLKLTPVNDKYAATTYNGKEGYIYYKNYKAIDYTDPHSEEAVTVEGFFGAPVYMRKEPLKNAPLIAQIPTDVRFEITFVTDTYAYLLYEGQGGYVYIADFVQMEYKKGQVEPFIAFSDEAVTAYDSPYYGAVAAETIPAHTPVTVNGFDGDHMTVVRGDKTLYVESGELIAVTADFEVEDFTAMVTARTDIYEYPMANAQMVGTVQKNEEVLITAFQGEYARMETDGFKGYIHYKQLKSNENTKAALEALELHVKRIEAQKFLNVALTMMEKDNPIVRMYNETMNAMVQPRFELGTPYLFAGMNESSLLRPRYASQNSNYYRTDKIYLGGFDCIGFARWLHNQVGMKKLPAISEIPKQPQRYLVKVQDKPVQQWYKDLEVGDSIAMAYKGGGYHIMVYIGTLRDFGYTEDMLGTALAPYIDYPLVIHCGMNNYHTAWYTEYIKENNLSRVTPPDGGVTISLIGVPYDKCSFTETMWAGTKNVKTFYWFDLEGYNLTSIDPTASGVRWYEVYRNVERQTAKK